MTNGIYYYFDKKKNSVVYVGRDSYIDKNRRHKAHMRGSQQFDLILQNNPDRYEYRVYCEGNFSNEELNNLEIQVIKLFNTHQREDAFNFTEGGEGIVGFEHSEETRKKMSEAHKGKKIPEETRKKISEANKGIKRSEETRKKISETLKGIKRSEETRKKMSEAHKGKKIPEETRKKISEARKGKYSGEKNPMYGKKHPEETRRKISDGNKGKKRSEETRRKMSEAHKKNYATVIKAGFNRNGKQNYALRHNGKTIKQSIYKEKLEKEAEERNKKNNITKNKK